MKINWLVRFKNKTFLASFLALSVSFVYNMLALFEITPALTQDAVMQAVNAALLILGMLGVIADPTTAGMGDSTQAMGYTEPKKE